MSREMTDVTETQQERLLRAALRDHARAELDTEAAWASVAPRLELAMAPTATAASADSHARRTQAHGKGKRMRWRWAALVAAAVTALVVVLAAASFGTPYWGGIFGGEKGKLIGDEHLYTAINQSQTVGDVTITVDKVYADPADTYLAVLIRVPASVASHYNNAVLNHFDVANASGFEPSGATESCEPLPHDGSAEHCLIELGPFQPNADGTHLTLDVQIGEVWLMRPNVHDPDERTGPWSFSFTFPFHQQSLGAGSGGAPSQPIAAGNP